MTIHLTSEQGRRVRAVLDGEAYKSVEDRRGCVGVITIRSGT